MKKTLLVASLTGALLVLSGCGSTQPNTAETKVVDGKGKSQSQFEEYKTDRPENKSVKIGNPAADLVFNSISKIYGQTIDLTDKYIAKTENSDVALKLNEVRKTQGDEEFKKQVSLLEGKDKTEYEEFMKNQVNVLEVSKNYLVEAIKLQAGVSNINVKSLVSNPFALPSAISGAKLSMDQVSFSVKALQMLKQTSDVYSEMLNYKGR